MDIEKQKKEAPKKESDDIDKEEFREIRAEIKRRKEAKERLL